MDRSICESFRFRLGGPGFENAQTCSYMHHEYTNNDRRYKIQPSPYDASTHTKRGSSSSLLQTPFCPSWSSQLRRETHAISSLDLERFDRPILVRIVQNSPVRAKLAHLGASVDALFQPTALVQVRLVDQLERVDVGLEVLCEEIVVVVANGVQQAINNGVGINPEIYNQSRGRRHVRLVGLAVAKPSGGDLVQHVCEGGTLLLDGDGVVSVLVSKIFHGRSQMTEENYRKLLEQRNTERAR